MKNKFTKLGQAFKIPSCFAHFGLEVLIKNCVFALLRDSELNMIVDTMFGEG